jgi:hypothetical protein
MNTQENFQMVKLDQLKWQHLHYYGLGDILGVFNMAMVYIDVV